MSPDLQPDSVAENALLTAKSDLISSIIVHNQFSLLSPPCVQGKSRFTAELKNQVNQYCLKTLASLGLTDELIALYGPDLAQAVPAFQVDLMRSALNQESYWLNPKYEPKHDDVFNLEADRQLSLYFREIARYRLLTAPEEIALGTIIKTDVPGQTELDSFQKDSDAHQAAHRLILANTRLVVRIAKRHQERGLHLSDLIGEGNLGLFKAIVRYDASEGFRFSTYASWWINQAIDYACKDKGHTIRVPIHVHTRFNQIMTAQTALEQLRSQSTFTDDEIAIQTVLHNPQNALSADQVRKSRLALDIVTPLSLDGPVSDKKDSDSLGEFFRDTLPTPEDQISEAQISSQLIDLIKKAPINCRNKAILFLRSGTLFSQQELEDIDFENVDQAVVARINCQNQLLHLDPEERNLIIGTILARQGLSFNEIGKIFGVTSERIRKLELKAIAALNRHGRFIEIAGDLR